MTDPSPSQPTKEQIAKQLENVLDPDINISITDLGLIYEINPSDDGTLHLVMTLTSLGCPMFKQIEADIKKHLGELGYEPDQIEVELVFDPPWSMEKMSESAKAMLGI